MSADTPQDVRDLLEQLKDNEEVNAPPKLDVRTIKDKKEYKRAKAEVIRSLARSGSSVAPPPEPKDVHSMTRKEYRKYKRRAIDAVRHRRP
jgi:hypothetical protein